MGKQSTAHDLERITLQLLTYCRANQWAGFDPYDALNSRRFTAVPLLRFKLPRLVLTQALKRSPIDVRRWLLIPKTQNAKAMALFLRASLQLAAAGLIPSKDDLVPFLVDRLAALRSPDSPYWCWGYSFPWQTRTIVVPTATPNLVCTSFVANALLDAYEQRRNSRCLEMAVNAAEYMLAELYWSEGNLVGFSYPLPTRRLQIHNANFLGAALLCRVYRATGENKFLEPALRVACHSVSMQHEDGGWFYGEEPAQRWIDNFHTGYNLGALRAIGKYAGTDEFEPQIRRGFDFYREHFLREDGAPRYFHDRTYPIDIHCVAQSILTLLEFRDLDARNVALAHSVFNWAVKHMWDQRGYFYYRVLRLCTIRTSYMRWSQAWMLLALSALISTPSLPVRAPSDLHAASLR
jgi:hypothetical protein